MMLHILRSAATFILSNEGGAVQSTGGSGHATAPKLLVGVGQMFLEPPSGPCGRKRPPEVYVAVGSTRGVLEILTVEMARTANYLRWRWELR